MQRDDIYEKVVRIILEIVNTEESNQNRILSEDMSLLYNGLGFSSIDYIQFIIKLEMVFNIQWPDEYLSVDGDVTIGEITRIIKNVLDNIGDCETR